MKTALVYDWFSDSPGGGEKAFEAVFSLFPSPIYTLFHDKAKIVGALYEKANFHTSFIEKILKWKVSHRHLLPLFPLAIEQHDLSSFDLVISCSHSVAKGVLTHSEQKHLCYCYTPMRYAWDLYHQYLDDSGLKNGLKGSFAKFFLHYLRMWDEQSSSRVDHFAAVSSFVAQRIQKTYKRKAEVIYPPVNTHFFECHEKKENFYLTASRLVPYKKIGLIIEAFSRMPDKKLIVIGDGPEMSTFKKKKSPNIELLGYQSNEALKHYMQKAKAFIYAAIEDFGIVPIEAQSCGTPVIALKKGALRETVIEGKTGLFFNEQTPESLNCAVTLFEKMQHNFDPYSISLHAENYSEANFRKKFQDWVEQCTS